MYHKLEVQITNAPHADKGKLNPAESYAALILEDAKSGFHKYRWDMTADEEHPSSPVFHIYDDAEGLVSELRRSDGCGKSIRYTMTTTRKEDGSVIYSSMEMVTADEPDYVLRDIYQLRAEYIMQQEDAEATAEGSREPVDPEDDSSIVDNFVQALLQDARARTHMLAYSRQPDDSFVCESFGMSETRIVLTKELETDHSDKYKVSLEYPDGSEVLSCMEVSELNVDSDLRQLYALISQQYPETYKDIAVKDAERFICSMRYQALLDRVLSNATTTVNTMASPGGERWLVMDIIKAAPSPRVIARHLIDELNKRYGVIPESESLRIRELVESTINSITHLKREPNGFTFTGKGIPAAHNKDNCWSNCLSRVANSWTTWPAEVYGADVVMNSKTVLTRIATLIVASVLCDQLK